MSDLAPALKRQLKKAGLEDPTLPPTAPVWQEFLKKVDEHYKRVEEDRELLQRSLELSTGEMSTLQHHVEADRGRLQAVVTAIGEALGSFTDVAGTTDPGGGTAVSADVITNMLTVARRRFATTLSTIFADEGATMSEDTAQVVESIRHSFTQLAGKLSEILSATLERATIKKELEVARAVQQLLFPRDDSYSQPHFSLAAHFQPAQEVSGDFWTANDLQDGRTLVVIGDVTGHGVASAIMTGVAKAACDLARRMGRDKLTPTTVLKVMNTALTDAGRGQVLMTCAATIIDADGKNMTVANAGHARPFLVHEGNITPIIISGNPLGSDLQSEYPAVQVPLEPGDTLFWYTDGVTEAENVSGEQLGDRRLKAALQAAAPADVKAARQQIWKLVAEFSGGRPQDDDVTFLVGRIS